MLSDMVIISADDWICIFCLLFRIRHTVGMLLEVGITLGLYSNGFLCVCAHYLVFHRGCFSGRLGSLSAPFHRLRA